ncbi:transcriptional regulator, IclR family [Pseudarthrobacter chlorophenolicus A6]|uniref:Transcriptional regulator, IclR family n=1 Tax=Pseudarthrobacter chlorophenolicus (strain ATCC 700700 / DSM 12829 / CIP 107037 / JCM 12360 / KCTC 9906 / NCIMB 13794 / A6) TaxID=452863 RepID=B8H8C0_PSECP|nr:IclR family transcriptional regulator [Pseudarthrobacter chlorophenolicus]ACL38094.1 transcriptional regulator, IclR family [Pseudarthrobacter chlorophenolicus A6]SDQ55340.1 transcriptional regulator, IclR family [Pseudarthrobacter chlorophenolicus]
MATTTPPTAGQAEEGPKSSNMRSLSRALEVFAELQRAERPQRLSDLARNCGMSLPTTLRILRVLQDFGMVSQTDKSYRIGPAVLPAARSFLENDPLVVAARPILQQVASQTGLTASLYSRLGFERILVARVDGEAPLRYDLPLGKRLPLTLGAAGKILLASASDDELQQVVMAAVASGQEDADLTADVLRGRLPEPGTDYAYSADERATGVLSVAMAVPNRTGRPTESISLTSPVEAASEATLKAGVPELRRAAGRLSELLEGSVY